MRAVQIAFVLATMSSAAVAGPFGIVAGTPVSHLKVFSRSGDLLTISVPSPDPEFEAYQVWAPAGVGVCKLIAIGKTEDSDGDGSDTRTEYATLKAMLAKSFGEPESYEYLHAGARWNSDRDWVTSLWRSERTQKSFWGTSGGPLHADDVGAIELETKASSANSSYNSVSFEFTNFPRCAAAQRGGRQPL